MSISEISAVSALPERSRARISAMAARALGPGEVRIVASSSSLRPLMTGTSGATARASSPSTRPSSSIQCRRPAWTSVKGRRSSTMIVTRFGISRTTSARRISGMPSMRAITPRLSIVHRLAPGVMAAAPRIRAIGTREAPRTSMELTAKRGEVVIQRAAPRMTTATATTTSATRPTRASWRAGRARRRRAPTRCPTTSVERSAHSAGAFARARGEIRPLLTEDANLGFEHHSELRVNAVASQLHERDDVGGAGTAAVDDEVRVLRRDLGPVEALALEARLLDQLGGKLAGRVLPDIAGRGEGQRLRGLLLLEARLDVLLDLGERPALELQPAADQHGTGRCVEGPIVEPARRLELTDGAIRVQVVDGAHEVADPAVRGAGVHGERAADGGRNAHQRLHAAEVQRGRLADQGRQADAGARDRLLAMKLRPAQAALELQHDAAGAAIAHEQVVAAAHHGHRQLLALGIHERVPDVVDVLRDHEDVGGPADPQRRVEAQGLFEPNLAPDLS